MKHDRIVMPRVVVAHIGAASIFALTLLVACWTHATGDLGPAQAGPPDATAGDTGAAANSQPVQAAHHPPNPAPVQSGMRPERQVLSASGNLRIEYSRDRQRGIRQISLQDAHNASNTTVLAEYKRNAWVVVSPDDQWLVLNTRDGGAAGAQLYRRVSAAPLKYEVPQELRVNGSGLQDLVWQRYLETRQQGDKAERNRVTIDGIAWEPDSHRVSISVAPIAMKEDAALPEPWTCMYDVTTKQIAAPADVAEGPSGQSENGAPDQATPRQSDAQAAGDSDAPSADEQSADLEGERFPATREEPITMADANELELSDIRYAINEMLARHGANFREASIKKTFSAFSWYQPRTDLSVDEVEKEFSEVEKQNIAVLRRARDAKVAAARRPERHAIRGERVDEESDGQRVLRGVLQGVSDALNGNN